MTTEQLKNWIKSQDPDYIGRIQLGGVDGNAERFLGVYPSPNQGPAHIAIGGPACTSYGTLYARLLLRWGEKPTGGRGQSKCPVGPVLRANRGRYRRCGSRLC